GDSMGRGRLGLGGVEVRVGANLGIYTQPISFIGLPVVAVPVPLQPLPIGVQIIAAPWREDVALRIAHALEQAGSVAVTRPALEDDAGMPDALSCADARAPCETP